MKQMLHCLILLLVYGISASASADIYKWVDEEGQVHYGDKPQGKSSEQMSVEEKPVVRPQEQDRREYQKRLLNSYATERKQKQEEKAKLEKQQAEQRQRCEQARQRLAKYKSAGFLYTKDKEGGRVILNDEQHKAALERAREAVKTHCK
jgi:hypothetical protein